MSDFRHSAFDEQPGLELNVQPQHEPGLEAVTNHPVQSPAPTPQQYYDAPQAYNNEPAPLHDPHAYKAAESQPMIAAGAPGYDKEHVAGLRQDRRICGLKRGLFFGLLALAIILVVGLSVGLGVGLSHKSSGTSNTQSNSTMTTTSTPIATSTPLALAAAGINSGSLGVPIAIFYQDAATNKIFINAHSNNSWNDPVEVKNLDPQPKTNTPLTTVQFPNAVNIQLFYLADNNTMYNAIGVANSSDWSMGTLGPQTNYGVTVANNTGFVGTAWMNNPQGQQYSTRVYYINATTSKWGELAQDPTVDWLVTPQIGTEQAQSNSKLAVAWQPGDSFTNTTGQELHLFYQDSRSNLKHQYNVNGNWVSSQVETLAQITGGVGLAANIFSRDQGAILRCFWLAASGTNGQLMSVKGTSGALGTFGGTNLIPNVDKALVAGGPLSAVSWTNRIRVYYQTLTNPNGIGENGLDADVWSVDGQTIPS